MMAATAAMPVGRNGSAATLQRSPVVIPTAQRHHRPPTTTLVVTAESTRPEDVAFYAELICIWWLYGAIVFYTATLAFSKSTCEARDTFEARYNDCYRVYSLDANTMMLVVVATAFAPIRFVFFFLFVLTVVAAFVIANLLGPSESYVPERFVSSLAIFVAQQLVCTVWSYHREQDARDSFVAQTNLEQQTREWQEIRLLAEAAATRAVSQEVVKQLLLRGERSIECPTALVCCFSIKNFARWSRSRSPADVVRMLSDLVRVYETELLPISTGTMVHSSGAVNAPRGREWSASIFAKVHTLGEDVMFVIDVGCDDQRCDDDGSPPSASTRGCLRTAAAMVWESVVRATVNAERVFVANALLPARSNAPPLPAEDDGGTERGPPAVGAAASRAPLVVVEEDVRSAPPPVEALPLHGGASQRPSPSSPRGGEDLVAVASIAEGPVALVFLPIVGATIANGAAVTECYEGLRRAMTNGYSTTDGRQVPLVGHDSPPRRVMLSPSVEALLPPPPRTATTIPSTTAVQQSFMVARSTCASGSTCNMDETPREAPPAPTAAAHTVQDRVGGSSMTLRPPPRGSCRAPAVVRSYDEARYLLSKRFTDPRVELEFRNHSHTNFEHRIVKLNAASMVGLALAMLFVCGVYDQWSWEVRSPLPYVVCSGLVGPLMLLALWCQPPCMVGCLEGLNWAFLYLCIGASVVTPQHASIFGGSILPWLYVGATVALQRPLWYPPLAMWALDGTFSIFEILAAILPLRGALSAQEMMVGVVVGVGTLVFSFLLRSFLDVTERHRFAVRRQLQETQSKLEVEADNLSSALQEMIPNRVAERMFKRARKMHRSGRTYVGQDEALLTTACEDQAFAVVHLYPARSAHRSLELLCSRGMSIAELFAVTDVVTKCVSENHGVVAKSCGDVLLVGLDEDSSTSSLCRSEVVRHVVRMVLHLRQGVSGIGSGAMGYPAEPPPPKDVPAPQAVECRAWVGMSLMMGAMIGAHAPSFEWYGVDVSTALHVVQRAPLAPDSPVPANAVVLSERAAYYFAQRHASRLGSDVGDDDLIGISLGGRAVWSLAGTARFSTQPLLCL